MSAHHTLATARDFFRLQTLSTEDIIASLPHDFRNTADLDAWVVLLRSDDLKRSGFGIRHDIPQISGSAAWHINPEKETGTLIAWTPDTVVVFAIVRGDPQCEATLSTLFGFGPDEMPPTVPMVMNFSRGQIVETAEAEVCASLPASLNVRSFGTLNGPAHNFTTGVKDPQVKAHLPLIIAALADTQKAVRVPLRTQAAAQFPAFDLTDTETTRKIDAQAPLTQHFKTVHGVMPATIKALRAVYTGKRYTPAVFAGVYGPDVPQSEPQKTPNDADPYGAGRITVTSPSMRAFTGLLTFAVHNDLPFSLFSPLATRFSPSTCDALMQMMAHGLDAVPEERVVEILTKNGGHRLLLRMAERVRSYKEKNRDINTRMHTLISGIPDLTVTPVKTAKFKAHGMSLELVRSAREIADLTERTFSVVRCAHHDHHLAPLGTGLTFRLVLDDPDLHMGYYVDFDADGQPMSGFTRRFNKRYPECPDGFDTREDAATALLDAISINQGVVDEIRKISGSPAFTSFARRTRAVLDGTAAAHRRNVHPAFFEMFGFETKEAFEADVPDAPTL